MVYEFRLRLYVKLTTYEEAQDQIDELMPQIMDVPRHNATMDGDVDFLKFFDHGEQIEFSKEDGWAFKDVGAVITRTEV